jgi:hypothetical protein
MTTRFVVARALVVTLFVALTSTAAIAQAKIDISGDWIFDVQTDQGGGSPTFSFKQTGDKLTGKYKGLLGEADLTGTVSGKTMKFSFSGDAQGTAVTVTYEGEIESNTSIKGKMDLGGVASGTFVGKRAK